MYDLKGSSRARYVNVESQHNPNKDTTEREGNENQKEKGKIDSIDEELIKRRKVRRLKAAAEAAAAAIAAGIKSSATSSGKKSSNSRPIDSRHGSHQKSKQDKSSSAPASSSSASSSSQSQSQSQPQVLLDDNLMEKTSGRPFPLKHKAKVMKIVYQKVFYESALNS